MRISRSDREGWHNSADDEPLSELIPHRDYSGMRRDFDELRVWLPEPAKIALSELAKRFDTSMTGYLTEYFATYLYGIHDLLRMRENEIGLYEHLPERRGSAMTPAGISATEEQDYPDLGKNIFALKMFVPILIKKGLSAWAGRAGITLSEFCRGLICAHLFGREYGQKWIRSWLPEAELVAGRWEDECAEIEDDE